MTVLIPFNVWPLQRLADRMASLQYPSGAIENYTRDSIGRITGITRTAAGITTTLVSSVSYLPFGPLTSLTFGNPKFRSRCRSWSDQKLLRA